MKVLIAYSSRTGNTKKIAEALYEAAPEGTVLVNVDDHPNPNDFDVIFVGYWVDRGLPDVKTQIFLRTLAKKKIILFQTLGANPTSEHAYTVFANAGTYLSEGNQVVGVFATQGAIDPALIEMMKKLPAGNAHRSPQMEATIQESSLHPNEDDLIRARAYMSSMVAKLH